MTGARIKKKGNRAILRRAHQEKHQNLFPNLFQKASVKATADPHQAFLTPQDQDPSLESRK